MIEKEVKRAGTHLNIRSTHFQNSYILKKIAEGCSNESIISCFGLSNRHALYR